VSDPTIGATTSRKTTTTTANNSSTTTTTTSATVATKVVGGTAVSPLSVAETQNGGGSVEGKEGELSSNNQDPASKERHEVDDDEEDTAGRSVAEVLGQEVIAFMAEFVLGVVFLSLPFAI